MVRIDALLGSWKSIRSDTAQALLDMPAEHLGFQPTLELMSFRDLAVHNLNAGHALALMLNSGDVNFAAPDFRERMKAHFLDVTGLDHHQLAGRLNSVIEEDCTLLARQTPEFWAQIMTRFDGQQVTRMEMLQYTKEHELTHRSQMFMYLRLKGIVPPTTRRRLAKK